MLVEPTALPTGNPIAQGDLCVQTYMAHGPFVWRSLRHLGVPPSDLDDALQEVFLVVHKKLHTWDGTCAMKTWLFGIARMIAMNMRKRAHVRRESPVANVPEPASPRGPDATVENAQAIGLAMQIVASMEPNLRMVFTLYEIEEMSMKEVASALDVPLQTAYSRLHRAREIFALAASTGASHD